MYRTAHRWPYWLALVALLWTSLSPAMARLWVDQTGDRIEICTSTGVAWVSVGAPTDDPAGSGSAPAGSAMAAMACDWCLLHAGAWDIPRSANILPVASATGGASAGAPTAPFLDNEHWRRPLSHAPPLLPLRLL